MNVVPVSWDAALCDQLLNFDPIVQAAVDDSDPSSVYNWILGSVDDDDDDMRHDNLRLIIDMRLRTATFDLSVFLAAYDDAGKLAALAIVTRPQFGYSRGIASAILTQIPLHGSLSVCAQARFDWLFRETSGRAMPIDYVYHISWVWSQSDLGDIYAQRLLDFVVSKAEADGAGVLVQLVSSEASTGALFQRNRFHLHHKRYFAEQIALRTFHRPFLSTKSL